MATYIFYNYQFTRIVRSDNDWTAGERGEPVDPEESFRRKQDILGKLFREDYDGQAPFNFINERKTKKFPHRYLLRPADGMVVMRIGNGRPYKAEDEQLRRVLRMDFPSCVVVVDNRPGVQCLLIQKRHKAFADVKQLEAILTHTLNGLLRPYKLGFRLDRLHTRDAFWSVVNDKARYPDGFRWMKCYLPPINLERLAAVVRKHLADPRERLGSDMTLCFCAPDGGRLKIDANDPRQCALVQALTEEVGGNVISLMPAGKGRKAICVGKDNFRQSEMADDVIGRLEEAKGDFARNPAFDELKAFTRKYVND